MPTTGDHGYVPWAELLRAPRSALSAEERRVVIDRQVQVEARLVPVSGLARFVTIVVLAVFVLPHTTFIYVWTVLALSVATVSMCTWLPRSRIPNRRAGRFDLPALVAEMIFASVMHAALAIYAYPRLDPPGDLLLTGIIAGILGAGALALFSSRAVGLSWLGPTAAGILYVYGTEGSRPYRVLTFVTVVYVLILAFGVLYQSASFVRRCLAEHAAEQRIRIIDLMLGDVGGGARDWLWETSFSGRLQNVSPGFAEAVGLSVEAVEGRGLVELIASATGVGPAWPGSLEDLARLERHLAGDAPFHDLHVTLEVWGEVRHLSLTGTPIDGHGGDRAWHGIGSDVTETLGRERTILQLANFDELTGLANRHRFQQVLDEMVAGRAEGVAVHLAMIDLDDFKSINDTLGHPMGDRLLKAVADRLASVASPTATCARIGGDEFAVIDVSRIGVRDGVVEADPIDWTRFLDVLDEPLWIDGTRLRAGASLGHASLPIDADTVDDLVVAADLAMYRAKQGAVTKISAFDHELVSVARQKAKTRHELAAAIDHHELELHFQPQVSVTGGGVMAFEALVRWRHPVRGLLPPAAFVTVAEETGLIVPLGEAVIDLACRAASAWPEWIKLAINVSALQLGVPGVAESFLGIVHAAGFDPRRLDVEVTESALVPEPSLEVLGALRAHGATVTVDDFGTGYSSLAALRRLPVDQLKIDRSFITPLEAPSDLQARAMVTAIVEIAEALGLKTVAEGVETTVQRAAIVDLGCDALQGFLEARPMPAADVPDYLLRSGALPIAER
jgi:diguanylate cyclase (GGDEF)-like protein/PAS domain S-box-containing protein